MTHTDDAWRRAMRTTTLAQAVRWLAILAAVPSLGLIALGAGLDGWVGCVIGGLGLVGAVLLWREV